MALIDELKEKREQVESLIVDAQESVALYTNDLAKQKARLADLDKAISALAPVPSPPDESSPQASGEEAALVSDDVWHASNEQQLKLERETWAEEERAEFDRGYEAGLAGIESDDEHSNAYHEGWGLGDHTRIMMLIESERPIEAPTEAERPSVVTDHDRVEQTNTDTVAAVEIPEGFIPWSGGECPVDPGAHIRLVLDNGYVSDHDDTIAGQMNWAHDESCGVGSRIIAYKLVRSAGEYDWGKDVGNEVLPEDAEASPDQVRTPDSETATVTNEQSQSPSIFQQQTEQALTQKEEEEPDTNAKMFAAGINREIQSKPPFMGLFGGKKLEEV